MAHSLLSGKTPVHSGEFAHVTSVFNNILHE